MQRTTGRSGQRALKAVAGLLLVTSLGSAGLDAQQLSNSPVRATVHASVGVVIPARMFVRALGAATAVATSTEYAELELRVQTAANLPWTLNLVATAGNLEVRSSTGEWIPVAAGATLALLESAQPTNQREVSIRFRVRGSAEARRAASAELVIVPTGGSAETRAASVSWTAAE